MNEPGPAHVLGNGPSRRLWTRPEGVTVFACNAAFRDLAADIDYLATVSSVLAIEAARDHPRIPLFYWGICIDNAFERHQAKGEDIRCPSHYRKLPPDFPEKGAAGTVALGAALMLGHDPITLIGWDGSGTFNDNRTTSVYDGSVGYPPAKGRSGGFSQQKLVHCIEKYLDRFPGQRVFYRPPSSFLDRCLPAEPRS